MADMSPEAIWQRLEQVSKARDIRIRKQRERVDMSPEAVWRRLRTVSELRDLCLELEKLGRKAEITSPHGTPDRPDRG